MSTSLARRGKQPRVPAVALGGVPVGPADARAQRLHPQGAQIGDDALHAVVLAGPEPLHETDAGPAGLVGFEAPLHTISPRAASSARASMPRSIAVCPVEPRGQILQPLLERDLRAPAQTLFARSEMSAKQWRMSPARYLPVICGSMLGRPMARTVRSATSLTVIGSPLEMLNACRRGLGASRAPGGTARATS